MKKRILSVTMAIMMTLSLAACGGGDDAAEETKATVSEKKEEVKEETKEEVKEETKEEDKEETKEEVKEETKEEIKEEIVADGINKKKEEAKAAFNDMIAIFDETTAIINENMDVIDEEVVSLYEEMVEILTEYKAHLESEDELTDEEYDEMIAWLKEAKEWAIESKAIIEAELAALGEEVVEDVEDLGDTEDTGFYGAWDFSGGVFDGAELTDEELEVVVDELYGGVLEFVFNEDGTADMVQGSGSISGYYEIIDEYSIEVVFDNNGSDLNYECMLIDMEGQEIMLINAVGSDDCMYFTYAE